MGLSIKNLYKAFGEKTIFSDFSYEFEDKGIYAIVGESGRGKTTLLRLIAGLDDKYKGEISGGEVSVCFQEYRLFPALSAQENVTEATGATDTEAENMLCRLGFSKEDVNRYPAELSGGMKQRVSLVRAFLKKSPILLLDEPTKELDDALKATLYSIIKEESKMRLVIFVSHNRADIEFLNPTVINL